MFNTPSNVHSTMTAKEEYKINNTLCVASIERLIDLEEDHNILIDSLADNVEDAKTCIEEAQSNLIEEDSFNDIESMLEELKQSVRGENKSKVMSILNCLQQLKEDCIQQNEYCNDELKKAKECLDGIILL